ncbi:MAG: hypothetical protein UZ18_ATM001002007 [Armatimonadetes bacterium OLB18]|nr:MAG: hypothetical protein UZ18_ATM001002007 [Armatimonadetes bacterium OLB18]
MNCWWPMPFDAARIEIVNDNPEPVNLYFYLDYEQHPSRQPDEVGRFCCQWRRESPTDGWCTERLTNENLWDVWGKNPNLDGSGNYTILDAAGDGIYVGCVLSVDCFQRQANDWYGEGDDMIFVDGELGLPRFMERARKTTSTWLFARGRSIARLTTALPCIRATPTGTGRVRTRCTGFISKTRFGFGSPFGCRSNTATPTSSRTITRRRLSGTSSSLPRPCRSCFPMRAESHGPTSPSLANAYREPSVFPAGFNRGWTRGSKATPLASIPRHAGPPEPAPEIASRPPTQARALESRL